MARSGRRTLARFGRPYPAIRRFACGVACRGAHPLPGRGAAVSRRCGKLSPPDGAAGLRRNPVDCGADASRTASGPACRPAPQGGRKALPAADERRGCGRRRGHGGGRAARRHARTPHGVLPERVVAPAGRIGTPHGDRFRAGQSRAVVAAAFQAGTPAEKPAGGRCRVAFRRGGGVSAQRRPGRGDVHGPAGGAGLGVGIRWAERPGRGGIRDAGLESQLAGRHQFSAVVRRRGGHPRLGRAALPPLPDPVEGRERRCRRLSDRVRGDCRHCAARFAHVRRRAAGRTGGQSAGHRAGRGRGVRRRIVDARTRRIPRPGVRVRHGERRRRDQRAGPADRLAARRCGRLHPRRMADGGGLRRFCACDPCGVERRTEKNVPLRT